MPMSVVAPAPQRRDASYDTSTLRRKRLLPASERTHRVVTSDTVTPVVPAAPAVGQQSRSAAVTGNRLDPPAVARVPGELIEIGRAGVPAAQLEERRCRHVLPDDLETLLAEVARGLVLGEGEAHAALSATAHERSVNGERVQRVPREQTEVTVDRDERPAPSADLARAGEASHRGATRGEVDGRCLIGVEPHHVDHPGTLPVLDPLVRDPGSDHRRSSRRHPSGRGPMGRERGQPDADHGNGCPQAWTAPRHRTHIGP